jgi:excisionase family DNA binding protein
MKGNGGLNSSMTKTQEPKPTLERKTRTLAETAEILGVSYHTVQRLIYKGDIRTVPGLRVRLIPVREIDRFLNLR